MKRALGLILAAVMLLPVGAMAQDPTPAPTLPPDSPWPSGLELRTDLEAIGWQWGASDLLWLGGPRWLGDEADYSAMVAYSASGDDLVVRVALTTYEVRAGWPYSVNSDWTALMEVMDRLPVDGWARAQVSTWVSGSEQTCGVHALPGGSVLVEHYSEEFPSLVSVRIQQGGLQVCPEPEPDATPDPTTGPASGQNVVVLDDASLRLEPYASGPVLVFFGYAHDPDVSPAMLGDLYGVFERVPTATALFVTVDPVRDTPEFLEEWTTYMPDNIIAVTGTPDVIRRLAESFGVQYARNPETSTGDYTMAIAGDLYHVNRSGEIIQTYPFGTPASEVIDDLLALEPAFAKKAIHTSEDDPEATYALVSGRYRMEWRTNKDACDQVDILVSQIDGDFSYPKPSRSSYATSTVYDMPEGRYKIEQRNPECDEWSIRLDWMMN